MAATESTRVCDAARREGVLGDDDVRHWVACAALRPQLALENVKFASPHGRFELDPRTHHVIQAMYIRETRIQDGKPTNVVVANLGTVRDPGA